MAEAATAAAVVSGAAMVAVSEVASLAAMVVVSEVASLAGPEASAAVASARAGLAAALRAQARLVQQDFKAAALQATVSSTAAASIAAGFTTASTMGEDSLPADSDFMGPATTTITTIIRITQVTIPTTTTVAATSCDGAFIPGTAGVSSPFRSADDSADFGIQNASAPGQLKPRDRARCG